MRALRDVYESCSYELNVTDPTSYEEAQQFQVRKDAMKEEFNAIQRNGTWELSVLPPKKTKIGVKWVFKTKY